MNASGGAPLPPSPVRAPAADTGGPGGAAGLAVSRASLSEWHEVVGWAADEGWNPGHGDVECFHPADPAGFFLGRLGGRVVSAVSIVDYSEQYAFLGYYLVHPEHRGTGLGLATWRAAFPHAGSRTVGLDAVPAQQATYERSGFTAAYRTLHFAGVPDRPSAVPGAVVPVSPGHLPAIAAYDRLCFPADRHAFLGPWLTGPGRAAYVHLQDGGSRVTGYAMIRPARGGWRIGPLFADSPDIAAALFDALAGHPAPGDEVHLDIPEHHLPALQLAASRGLTARSHTVRMYTAPVTVARADATWAVTSLELG